MQIYDRYLQCLSCKTLDVKHYAVLYPDFVKNTPGDCGHRPDFRKMVEAPMGHNLAYIFYNEEDPCPQPMADLMKKIEKNHVEVCRIRMEEVELPFLVQIVKDPEYTKETGPGGLVVAINKFEPAGAIN